MATPTEKLTSIKSWGKAMDRVQHTIHSLRKDLWCIRHVLAPF